MQKKAIPVWPLRVQSEGALYLTDVGDVHWGSKSCDKERFLAHIESIKNGNLWWVGTGDLAQCDLLVKTPMGATWQQEFEPGEQFKQLKRILQPISDLCAGIISGNHEHRIYKATGFDAAMMLAEALGVPYSPLYARFPVRAGKNTYYVYVKHPRSGARTLAYRVRLLEDMQKECDADVYLMGHFHSPLAFQREWQGRRGVHSRTFVITSHFQFAPSYAVESGYALGQIGHMTVRFGGEKNELQVLIGNI